MENFNGLKTSASNLVLLLFLYTCFVLHNYCLTKSLCALDEDEVKAHTEWHKLEETNIVEQSDPVHSSNTLEWYIMGIITGYINRNLDTS